MVYMISITPSQSVQYHTQKLLGLIFLFLSLSSHAGETDAITCESGYLVYPDTIMECEYSAYPKKEKMFISMLDIYKRDYSLIDSRKGPYPTLAIDFWKNSFIKKEKIKYFDFLRSTTFHSMIICFGNKHDPDNLDIPLECLKSKKHVDNSKMIIRKTTGQLKSENYIQLHEYAFNHEIFHGYNQYSLYALFK